METKIRVREVIRSIGTMKEVGYLCGVSAQAVKKWGTRNRVPVKHVYKLAVLAHVSPSDLNPLVEELVGYKKSNRSNRK